MGDATQPPFGDFHRALGRIEGEMIAHRGETARLAGQIASMAEESRRAREALDNRLTRMSSEFSKDLGKLDVRIDEVERRQSERSGAHGVVAKIVEWTVLAIIGVFSAVALWFASDGKAIH